MKHTLKYLASVAMMAVLPCAFAIPTISLKSIAHYPEQQLKVVVSPPDAGGFQLSVEGATYRATSVGQQNYYYLKGTPQINSESKISLLLMSAFGCYATIPSIPVSLSANKDIVLKLLNVEGQVTNGPMGKCPYSKYKMVVTGQYNSPDGYMVTFTFSK